ncbi:hypothetical protein RCL1_000132 [Eukaryota sp. TZLM3-RCL]
MVFRLHKVLAPHADDLRHLTDLICDSKSHDDPPFHHFTSQDLLIKIGNSIYKSTKAGSEEFERLWKEVAFVTGESHIYLEDVYRSLLETRPVDVRFHDLHFM